MIFFSTFLIEIQPIVSIPSQKMEENTQIHLYDQEIHPFWNEILKLASPHFVWILCQFDLFGPLKCGLSGLSGLLDWSLARTKPENGRSTVPLDRRDKACSAIWVWARFEVIINIASLHSIVFPCPSVIRPSSNKPKRIGKASGWAWSTK